MRRFGTREGRRREENEKVYLDEFDSGKYSTSFIFLD